MTDEEITKRVADKLCGETWWCHGLICHACAYFWTFWTQDEFGRECCPRCQGPSYLNSSSSLNDLW